MTDRPDEGGQKRRRPERLSVRDLIARKLSLETRGFARDSFLLTIGSGIAMAGYFGQIALISHLLGLEEYGVFAIVVSFVALISGVFDVQVGDTAIAFAADKLNNEIKGTAGVFQFGYLVEIVTGVVALVAVAALAPFVGPWLVDDEGALLFVLYGLTLLAGTTTATSMSLLRLLGRFGAILRIIVVREALRVAAITFVLLAFGTLTSVALALVALEAIVGALSAIAAGRAFSARSGLSLWDRSLDSAREVRRSMLGMIVHTNLITYAKLVVTQAPTLVLGALRPPIEVGAYKVGMAIASAVEKPADPAWKAIMPRLSKLWSAQRIADIRQIVRQATVLAAVVLGLGSVVVLLLRDPLLRLVGGQEAAALASTVLVLGLLGTIVNGVFFWNTPLIYSARRAATAMRAYVLTALVLMPVLLVFCDQWGANGAAVAVLVATVMLNALLTWSALNLLDESDRRQLDVQDVG